LKPELSDKSLALLEARKDSLLKHGHLKSDFSVYEWADDSFLRAAKKEYTADLENGIY
jgi:hypothetical protein